MTTCSVTYRKQTYPKRERIDILNEPGNCEVPDHLLCRPFWKQFGIPMV